MKKFEEIKKGYEVEFINSEGKLENGLVTYLDNKIFGVQTTKYSELKKEFYSMNYKWYLSGKKTSRYYNYGEVKRIVNKWNN